MRKRICITGSLLIIIFCIAFICLNYATNYLLSFITSNRDSVAMDSKRSFKEINTIVPDKNPAPEQNKPSESDYKTPPIPNTDQSKDQHQEDKPTNPNQLSQPNQTPNSSADSSKKPDQTTQEKFTYSPDISTEKQEKVQQKISVQDKAAIASVLLKKLSASDLSLFMKMASGGLTVEEKREAKKIFLQKLTEDEYNQLIAIAAKYGLSEGKNYQESLKQNLDAPNK